MKKLFPSSVDFAIPTSLIGISLKGDAKHHFEIMISIIDKYLHSPLNQSKWCEILDEIEVTKSIGVKNSMKALESTVLYLRHKLLYGDTQTVYYTVLLLDVLVKNSGYRIHVLIGRKVFMKTMSVISRRYLAKPGLDFKRIAELIIGTEFSLQISFISIQSCTPNKDCIQAWGEAFLPRRHMYPYIYETYMKTRYKYGIRFPRPDFDPTRVPIFLGPISQPEKQIVNQYGQEGSSASYETIAEKDTKGWATEAVYEETKEATEAKEMDLMDMQYDLIDFDSVVNEGNTASRSWAIPTVSERQFEFNRGLYPPPIPPPPPPPPVPIGPTSSDSLTLPSYLPPPVPTTGTFLYQNRSSPYPIPTPSAPITGTLLSNKDGFNSIGKASPSNSDKQVSRVSSSKDLTSAFRESLSISELDAEVQKMLLSRPQPATKAPSPLQTYPISNRGVKEPYSEHNYNSERSPPPITSLSRGHMDVYETLKEAADERQNSENLTQSPSASSSNVNFQRNPGKKGPPAFIVPSSAPENEIRYYGTQRVVITRGSKP